MIENYKGWDITLNWDNKDYLERDTTKNNFFNQKEKWIGVNLNGENIFCLPIGHLQTNGDYQCSWQPLEIKESLIFEAKRMTSLILNNLNGAGLYGVEFFIKGSEVIFSELSPRPHDTCLLYTSDAADD